MTVVARSLRTLGLVCLVAQTGCDPGEMFGSLFGGEPSAELDADGRIDAMARQLGLQAQADGSYAYASDDGRITATVKGDGTVNFADMDELAFTGPADFKIRGDRTGELADDQLELLQVTSELRREMSVRWYDDLVDRSLETLDAELTSILDSHHLSIEQRRAMIFERWDTCDSVLSEFAATTAESAIDPINTIQVEGAGRARARIEAFVRKKLPSGSDDAYRTDELERLNQHRKSDPRFAPYDDAAAVG